MQSLNINTAKIDKSALYEGKQGKYLSLTLMDNRDGVDQYGNDGFIVQDIGKERRLAGEKGPIVGNWKYVGQKPGLGVTSPEYGKHEQRSVSQGGAKPPANVPDDDGVDEIPF